jgi:cell division protein FtsI/penicillin-binding protein 2
LNLKEYWKLFGYGTKTGIDLVGEKEGFLPDPTEKEKRKGVTFGLLHG